MRSAVEEEFHAAPKPLTTALFALGNDGPTPVIHSYGAQKHRSRNL
jgi:hypothetical protein